MAGEGERRAEIGRRRDGRPGSTTVVRDTFRSLPDAADIVIDLPYGHSRMRAVAAIIVLVIGIGCGPIPHHETTPPPSLGDLQVTRDVGAIRIEVRAPQWYDADRAGDSFVLAFPAPAGPATSGRSRGAVRSGDVELATADTMRCAWQVVPMGDDRPCAGISRVDAMAEVQPAIHQAFDELRVRAAQAKATAVTDVRCFTTFDHPHLWCEGTALVPDSTRADRLERVEVDPSEPTDAEPELATNRFALAAAGGVTMLGSAPSVTAALALRYRPIEIALELESPHHGALPLFAIGLSALWRIALPTAGLDAIVGGEASAVAPNNSVNPTFHGLYEGFIGVSYQTAWKIQGKAQPYVQLRVGVAHVRDVLDSPTVPLVGLAIGLSSPQR